MAGERFRVLRRFVVTAFNTVNIAASAVGAQAVLNSPNVQIDPTQAMRIIAGSAAVADGASSGKLVGLNAALNLLAVTPAGGLAVRAFGAPFGGVVVGLSGQAWEVTDDEYVYGNDYLEIGAHGLFTFSLRADLTNTDAAIHAVTLNYTLLLELYQQALPLT